MALVVSVSNGYRVIARKCYIVGAYVYLVYDMTDKRVYILKSSHFALEVRIMPCNVRSLYVHQNEVLVLGPLYHGFCFSLVVCLYAASCSSDVDYVDACGIGDSFDHCCSGDAGAA